MYLFFSMVHVVDPEKLVSNFSRPGAMVNTAVYIMLICSLFYQIIWSRSYDVTWAKWLEKEKDVPQLI